MTEDCRRVFTVTFKAEDGTTYTWYCKTCGKYGTDSEKFCKDEVNVGDGTDEL